MPTQDTRNPIGVILDALGIPSSPGALLKQLLFHTDDLNATSDKHGTPDFSTRIDDVYAKDGYRQNPADGKWYKSPPAPGQGDWSWDYPASPGKEAELDKWQDGAIKYNEIHDYLKKPRPQPTDGIKSKMGGAEKIPSPIILDLDGDGIETTAVKSGAYFDHASDGFAEQSGWAGKDDGLLVRDLDGNGQIDTGAELFGSETLLTNGSKGAHGFEALAELDSNLDGVIDSSDAIFATLRIWKDVDGDGYTDDGELLNLEEAGVQSINVGYSSSTTVDANGNVHKQVGSYTTAEGQSRAATDVWFQTDATYSIATESIVVPEDIALLPDASGYGKVRDLHQAMAKDATGELKVLVTAFTEATTPEDRDALVTQIIYHWTGVQDIDPTSRASRMIYGNAIGDARKLEALEEFMGEEWVGVWCWGTRDPNPHGRAAPVLLQAWDELKAMIHGQLLAQSHSKGLFEAIAFVWHEEVGELVGDLAPVAGALTTSIQNDREAGLAQLGDFLFALKGTGMLSLMDVESFKVVPPAWCRTMDIKRKPCQH